MCEELKLALLNAMNAEGTDDANYEKLANMAEKSGMHHTAGVLRDIACEENTHKQLIKMILDGEIN